MQVENSVYPSEEQFKGFSQPGPDGPIYMVNLLKFKAHAEYADGRETSLTGAEHRTYKLGSGITSEYGHYVKSPGEP